MGSERQMRSGHSRAESAASAVAEFHAQVAQPEMALVLFFCSPGYDLEALAAAMNRCFPGVPVIGCTTAGEIGPQGYASQSLSGVSFSAGAFVAEIGRMDDLHAFDPAAGSVFAAELAARLQLRSAGRGTEQSFGLLLIDGLSLREEIVSLAFQDGLGGMHLIGGSAGDDLRFERTCVFHDGAFHSDSAVLALLATHLPFRVLQTQHFIADDERLVVTEVDAARRVVREINGRPAREEYARLIGCTPEGLTSAHFSASPVVVMIDGQEFVRSISHANADGSLTFFCALDEGVVLRIARSASLLGNLEATLATLQVELGGIQGMLVCDCILRNLEITRLGIREEIGALFRRYHAVGFSTYGEQIDGVHVNQTLTGIAFGEGGRDGE